ncbi:uncharacterized protein LOC135078205 [Ostrinia nubilalis]|uniref:uncharacterized protein LOC135078205 n=1 Tax=Ostrinia nubilalis TaxID=29057 RepID=UPI0030822291
MAVISNIIGFAFVYLVFLGPFGCKADTCAQKGPCSCVYPNGTGIDLSPSVLPQGFYQVQGFKTFYNASVVSLYELDTYYFHPCADVSLNVSRFSCNRPMSMYREVYKLNKTAGAGIGSMFNLSYTNCEFLGNKEDVNFTSGPSISFRNGPSTTTILLICSEGDSRLQIYSLTEPNAVILAFYSKDACLKQIEEPGRSFGSTLLIIFFSFIIFYLVLGVCTKKFLMGATGIEVIPNLAFWSDLPNLVKDGWAFAIRGCQLPTRGMSPAGPSDPNSYDSI